MNPQIRPGRQLRRSKRLVLSVPVHVFGQDVFRESFNEFTRMVSVNAHGGALAIAARIEKGQGILLVNKSTGEERECRVVHVGSLQDGKYRTQVAIADSKNPPFGFNPASLSGLERAADNVIGNRHLNFRFALHAINSLVAQLRDSGAGDNVNNLFLFAVRT